MNYLERDVYGLYKSQGKQAPHPRLKRKQPAHQTLMGTLMGVHTLIGDKVCNLRQEALGNIKEILVDIRTGKITFALLSYAGMFTLGEKMLPVPWAALTLDEDNQCFVLDIRKDRFEDAPGFDVQSWPNMADQAWVARIHRYYQIKIKT